MVDSKHNVAVVDSKHNIAGHFAVETILTHQKKSIQLKENAIEDHTPPRPKALLRLLNKCAAVGNYMHFWPEFIEYNYYTVTHVLGMHRFQMILLISEV